MRGRRLAFSQVTPGEVLETRKGRGLAFEATKTDSASLSTSVSLGTTRSSKKSHQEQHRKERIIACSSSSPLHLSQTRRLQHLQCGDDTMQRYSAMLRSTMQSVRHCRRCRQVERYLHTSSLRLSHENPLGLPRNNSPPTMPRRSTGPPKPKPIPNVKSVVVVSSAKGGVGKSTVSGEANRIALHTL